MFKFNTQRSTITGSECVTFERTEYRSQSVCQITVRTSNHSVTVTLSNIHIWIRRFSHKLASLQQARSKLHISSQTSIRTQSFLWTVLTHLFLLRHLREQDLTTEFKDSRNSLIIYMTRSSKLRYHNSAQFPFPTFSFCNIWRGTHETSCISDTIQRTHRLQCHRIDITEVNGKKNIL
jgi:hypothetical protein